MICCLYELNSKRSLLGVTQKIKDFKTIDQSFTKKKEQLKKVRENLEKVLKTLKPKLEQNIKKCLLYDNSKMIIRAKLNINKSRKLLNKSNKQETNYDLAKKQIEIEREELICGQNKLEEDYVSVKKEIDLILNLYSESIIGKDNNERMKYLSDNFDKIHNENLIEIIDDRIKNLDDFKKNLMAAYRTDQLYRNNLISDCTRLKIFSYLFFY